MAGQEQRQQLLDLPQPETKHWETAGAESCFFCWHAHEKQDQCLRGKAECDTDKSFTSGCELNATESFGTWRQRMKTRIGDGAVPVECPSSVAGGYPLSWACLAACTASGSGPLSYEAASRRHSRLSLTI